MFCRGPVTLPKLPPAPLQIVPVMLKQRYRIFNKYKCLFSIESFRPLSTLDDPGFRMLDAGSLICYLNATELSLVNNAHPPLSG
jgi:hypothetical protein